MEETAYTVDLVLGNFPLGYLLPVPVQDAIVSYAQEMVWRNLDNAVKLVVGASSSACPPRRQCVTGGSWILSPQPSSSR